MHGSKKPWPCARCSPTPTLGIMYSFFSFKGDLPSRGRKGTMTMTTTSRVENKLASGMRERERERRRKVGGREEGRTGAFAANPVFTSQDRQNNPTDFFLEVICSRMAQFHEEQCGAAARDVSLCVSLFQLCFIRVSSRSTYLP